MEILDVNNYSLETDIDKAAKNVVQLLCERKMRIASAESCTGGLVSAAVTSVPGSSDVFDLGICTYANKMKTKYLEVPDTLIKEYGVVSTEVAKAMAAGVKKASGADIAVSTSGIAGPGGGSAEKPVGTVCIGLAAPGTLTAHKFLFSAENCPSGVSERDYIRFQAVRKALDLVIQFLKG